MELARTVLVFLHLLGFAALFGGLVVQVRRGPRTVNGAMLSGALLQIVTGLLLVGVLEGLDEGPDGAKVAVKLAVALLVGALVAANRTRRSIPSGLYFVLLGLTVLDAGVAVFWTPAAA